MIGKKFGKLLVIGKSKKKHYLKCKCACGVVVENVYKYNLLSGKSRSCGCVRDVVFYGSRVSHGMSYSPEYSVWLNMKNRCNNKNGSDFHLYGGRGISVCDRWLDFECFYKDMGKRPRGKTLDRINNNGNYEPSNCRWATPKQQAVNRRPKRTHRYNGVDYSIAEIAKKTGLSYATIASRVYKKWSISRIMESKKYINQYS